MQLKNQTASSPSTKARCSESVEAESKKNQEAPQMADRHVEREITTIDDLDATNRTTNNGEDEEAHCRQLLDELYERIASENNTTKLQKVLLSSSYPSPISLKLQGIQEMLKDNKGRMDTDSINFAIRKLRREETIDRSPTDSESMICKYYFSTDFARLASEEDGLLDLETCVRNDFVYHHHHHNAFGQDPKLSGHHSMKEVLCIPVVHHGCWSLYAFNISDKKLSIFDLAPERAFGMSYQKLSALNPTSETETESSVGRLLVARPETEHDNTRLKICKALEFVKGNFNLFKNASGKFSSWRYEFTDLGQFRETSSLPATPLLICSDEDSGFFVFNFMRRWDGQRFIHPEEIPKEPKELRKGFLEYIVSFNCNEVYELDDLPDVFGPMEKLKRRAQKVSGRPAWTRCKMDTKLLKAVRENNADEFAELFKVSTESNLKDGRESNLKDGRESNLEDGQERKMLEDDQERKMLRQNLRRGATCDGDGVLHIAARYGDLKLLCAIFKEVHVELNLEAIKRRMLEGSKTDVEDACVQVLRMEEEKERQQRLVELQEMLRSRNHKGETCLHEAVRHGDQLFVLSLILADEKIMKDVIKTNNGRLADGNIDVIKTNGPLLVQIVDYEGVSPLYLATTLCRSNVVRIILTTRGLLHVDCIPSFSGPGGKTAMHAAVLLNRELTQQLLNWMKKVKAVPDLNAMTDNSGNTPLHLVSSVCYGAYIAELLLSETAKVADGSGTAGKPTCAALKKDYKGWLPIHVAAASGSLEVIKQLIVKCPECMESRNARGQSFLHVAVEKKRWNVVRYVCSSQSLAGILNLTDHDGNTALHLAVEGGNQLIFCDLMGNWRVHLSFTNRKGWTPLDAANLSMGPGIRLMTSSRVMIYWHLKKSGALYGTCRRDVLDDEIAGKLDKDKLSESVSKLAGLVAVCAILILNMSVTTFFNIAKQHLTPTAAPVPVVSAAEGRVRAFKALIVFDAITFASSVLAVFCCTVAGFSITDHRARFLYLSIAGFCLPIAFLGLLAICVLAAHLAFTPVDRHIALVACVLPLAPITPHVIIQTTLLLLHVRARLRRRFFL